MTTFRFGRGLHALTWRPPAGLAAGTYPVQVAATNRAGRTRTLKLPPVVVAWDTTPPQVSAQLQAGTLTWQGNDPGTPWLALRIDLVDPAGVSPPQSIDLAQQPLTGGVPVTVPPGTWQATLSASNSAALATTVDLGIVTSSG